MRKAIGAAIIEGGRILLVKEREVWTLPGGKPEEGESDSQCLEREISEELPDLRLRNLQYFAAFVGITPHQGDELQAEVYFAQAIGKIDPGAEISQAEWVKDPEERNLSDITRKIVLSLRQNGYL